MKFMGLDTVLNVPIVHVFMMIGATRVCLHAGKINSCDTVGVQELFKFVRHSSCHPLRKKIHRTAPCPT